ncbi:hypothetical protein GCM10023080_058000 [Streptomyces pseudoechinosporeus]
MGLPIAWEGPLAPLHPFGRPLESQAGVFRAPRQGGDDDRLLAREESEEVRLRDTGTLGNRLGRGAEAALERELGDRSAEMTLSRLS